MYRSRVSGTYYNMGFGYGSLLYRHGYRVPEVSNETLAFGRECEKEVKRIFPDVLDEIRGFADACHTSYEHLVAFIFSIGTFKPTGCSIFATDNGSEIVFGRNYDFFYRFKRHSESFLTKPAEGYYSMGNSDIFIGREDGVNEKGLAVTMAWVAPKTINPGINFILLTRYFLDKCANVREALKTLTRAHHVTANNYLLADREGDIAVVKACTEKVRIRRPEDGFIVCANHFVHDEMVPIEDHRERPSDSVLRYATLYKALEENVGKMDIKTAQRILSDHIGGVCSHKDDIQLGTLWSLIADLKQLRIFLAEGHPCRAKYREDTRLNKALKRA
jgi:predicted choloylglycine hydrolase